ERRSTGASGATPAATFRLRRDGLALIVDQAHAHVGDIGDVPDALLAGHAAEVDRAVSESRRWLWRFRWTASAAGCRTGRLTFTRLARRSFLSVRRPVGGDTYRRRGQRKSTHQSIAHEGSFARLRVGGLARSGEQALAARERDRARVADVAAVL